jgi:hypothetical protein
MQTYSTKYYSDFQMEDNKANGACRIFRSQRHECRILGEKSEDTRIFGRRRHRWEDNIKQDFKVKGYEVANSIQQIEDSLQSQAREHGTTFSDSVNKGDFIE